MGAMTFMTIEVGKNATEAFRRAVEAARWEHGNGGYSGSIAEKRSFVVIACPEGERPMPYANKLLDEGDERIDDKYGPAGCIELGDGKYLFFGWASS